MKLWVKVTLFSTVGFAAGFGAIFAVLNRDNTATAASGKNPSGKPLEIEWGTLRELDLSSGKPGPNLKNADGAIVRIPGFIVPLEDNQNAVSEFLLVPSPQACIHVPAPPPNQMVHVKMASGKRAQMSYGPVWAQGRLRISEVANPYGKSSFEMVGELTEPYQ